MVAQRLTPWVRALWRWSANGSAYFAHHTKEVAGATVARAGGESIARGLDASADGGEIALFAPATVE